MSNAPKHVAVVGGGPSGLMAAQALLRGGARVTVIDRMPSLARKFLMAGRGGLNLTHSEPLEAFLARYGDHADKRLLDAIRAFPPRAQIQWAEGLGQDTFIGSSGRVFPKAMKASPLLRAWLSKLEAQGLAIMTRSRLVGLGDDGTLALQREDEQTPHQQTFDAVLLALGGASWPRLGSDGRWVELLTAIGVPIEAMQPANAGVRVAWSNLMQEKHAGEPLKRIALDIQGTQLRGETMITRSGLEGGAIYAATEAIRAALARGPATLTIDLRPDLTSTALAERLAGASTKDSASNRLRKAGGLSSGAIGLLQEVARPLPREPHALAALIKAAPVIITGFSGLERAISSSGGVAFSALDEHWMLRSRPGVFISGEMLDWTAPTGGYLLTACLATGRAAGEGCLAWLAAASA